MFFHSNTLIEPKLITDKVINSREKYLYKKKKIVKSNYFVIATD